MRPLIVRLCRLIFTLLIKVTLPFLSERIAFRACNHHPGFTSALQNQYHTSLYVTFLRGSLWVEGGKTDLREGEVEEGRRFINPSHYRCGN